VQAVKDNHVRDSIRKTWDIDPSTKLHNPKNNSKQRRRFRQACSNFTGRVSAEDLENLEMELDEIEG